MSHPPQVGDYAIVGVLGSGSFAVVYKAKHVVSGLIVAIKSIRRDKLSRKLQENLEAEISILKSLDHPNIVKLLGIERTADHIHLILEYCGGGDLAGLIKRRKMLTETAARHFLRQLASGLHYVHSYQIIHRDLKPSNLLLSSESEDAVLKIGDFGFARYIQPAALAETTCGSPLYMAPEILRFQKYDAKADLWSVGAILFEMLTGRPPFTGDNHKHLLENIETQELRLPRGMRISPACFKLLQGLLRRRAAERMSYEEFFAHPFVDLEHFDRPAVMAAAGTAAAAAAAASTGAAAGAAAGAGADHAAGGAERPALAFESPLGTPVAAAAAPTAAAAAAGDRSDVFQSVMSLGSSALNTSALVQPPARAPGVPVVRVSALNADPPSPPKAQPASQPQPQPPVPPSHPPPQPQSQPQPQPQPPAESGAGAPALEWAVGTVRALAPLAQTVVPRDPAAPAVPTDDSVVRDPAAAVPATSPRRAGPADSGGPESEFVLVTKPTTPRVLRTPPIPIPAPPTHDGAVVPVPAAGGSPLTQPAAQAQAGAQPSTPPPVLPAAAPGAPGTTPPVGSLGSAGSAGSGRGRSPRADMRALVAQTMALQDVVRMLEEREERADALAVLLALLRLLSGALRRIQSAADTALGPAAAPSSGTGGGGESPGAAQMARLRSVSEPPRAVPMGSTPPVPGASPHPPSPLLAVGSPPGMAAGALSMMASPAGGLPVAGSGGAGAGAALRGSAAIDPKLVGAFRWLRARFAEALQRATQLQSLLPRGQLLGNPDEIVYRETMNLMRAAVADELHGNVGQSASRYRESLALLRQLELSAERMHAPSRDRDVLSSYIAGVSKRLLQSSLASQHHSQQSGGGSSAGPLPLV